MADIDIEYAERRIAQGSDDARPCIDGPYAWRRACGVCAFRQEDPQQIGPDLQEALTEQVATGDLVFYCLHRETPCGSHRVCASADAMRRAQLERAKTDRLNSMA